MIYSDEQYQNSVHTLKELEGALVQTEAVRAEKDWLKGVEVDALKSQMSDIRDELSHYDSLKAGEMPQAGALSLKSLPAILVETRIASGMTQMDLADALGVDLQRVQQWEDSDYGDISLYALLDVVKALKVRVNGDLVWSCGSGVAGRRIRVLEGIRG